MRVFKKISTPFIQSKPDKAIIVVNAIDPQINTIKAFIQACDDYTISYTIFVNKCDKLKEPRAKVARRIRDRLGLKNIWWGSARTMNGMKTLRKYIDLWKDQRIIILGVFNSGKTSIINNLCNTKYEVGTIPGTTLEFTETDVDGTVIIDSIGQLIDIHKPMMVSIDFSECSNRDERIDRVFSEEIDGLTQTKESCKEAIKLAIPFLKRTIEENSKIIVVGAGASALVAKEIAGQGTECGLPIMVFTNDGAEIQPISFSKGLGEQEESISRYISLTINVYDTVIGVSASGGTGFVYDTLRKALDKGAFRIAITENADTPIGKYADVIIKSDAKPEGPCLHPETSIMEASMGLVNISDIKPGDEILSVQKSKYANDNSRYKHTKGFFDKGLKWSKVGKINKTKANELLEIKYIGGGCIKATPNHIFFDSRGRKILAKDLKIGMKLFKPKYAMDLQGFDRTNKLELLAYYTAEGSTSRGSVIFTINSKELEKGLIGDRIIRCMKSVYNCNPRIVYKHNGTTCDIWFNSTMAQREFEKICGKGAWNKRVPYWLNRCDKESFSKYLKAIVEGDGYITKDGKMRLRSVSKKLITELGWICQMHGIPYSISEMKQPERKIRNQILKESYIWQLQLGRNAWNELCNINKSNIIEGITPVGRCKKDINKPLKSTAIIKSIKRIPYKGDVYDLVDVDGNAFYAGDTPVLTHNSSSKIQTAHLVIGHALILALADELGVSADESIGYMLPEVLENKKMGIK